MERVNLNFGTSATLQGAYEGSLAQSAATIQTAGGLPVSVGPLSLVFGFQSPGRSALGVAPLSLAKGEILNTVNYRSLSPVDIGDTNNPGSNLFTVFTFSSALSGGFLVPNSGRIKFSTRLSTPFFSPTQGEAINETIVLVDCDSTGVAASVDQISTSTINPNYTVTVPPLALLGGGTLGLLTYQVAPLTDKVGAFRSYPGRRNFISYFTS